MGQDKLEAMGDFPFARLNRLVDGVTPPDGLVPIAMQIGEPQAAVPDHVMADIAARADLFGRYPPPPGSDAYRGAVADWLVRRYALAPGSVDPATQVIATSGSREALFQAALAAAARKQARLPDGVRPAVLVPNPLYHVYAGGAYMADCDLIPVATTPENDFTPDYAGLPEEVLARTAICFLCTPGNPTGAVAKAGAIAAMIQLARAHDFTLAVDECYSEIWFDRPPPGGLEVAAGMDEAGTNLADIFSHVLTFNSLSKRSGAPGLRCGFIAGDAGRIADIARVRSYGGATLPGPLMHAGAHLWGEETHVAANRARYGELVDIAESALGHLPGYRRPEAAFFLWLDVRPAFPDGETAARALWERHGVKVMPGRYMARAESGNHAGGDACSGPTPGDAHVRIALVHAPAVTRDACARIASCMDG
ncbi:aminotransferase class I/II-fold pyridoxal phosphate-dependent enzyme [Marivibrio halodurans]|uniref:Aminotransferase class I/II-fold pyridoxal phosphate-dependent enzyme n=1 Tax=Marivibrio halodurans TaxID=2039722 RepID=A0A8J7SK02_9PROT|nr:aminotransferase class I/II-fold pyridoxal phosphate-dependent enzyme [Marivibrio halodurans]MBP5858113.1 aminotransferase class I/II-fold pyridoxal phosphate-dependent enzyme [Marivibrio halodurans]